ncbi:MAG: arginine--tRNA ligase [Candidatus Sungbacteria bacterium RIFCSPLOWO2_12_FULL_41_11]|uniref:Arginine--tRNA ligase n=1 Tax=Candidatus Sungbacteria bacterium RIFCSPLOWO2_12_FULL_41_11 TaxID=1802286 RepID=A0A1G2LMV4_9BACT|nr:MAG: Arginine-tRNA ligase [Parcubacteria group bacterium GW2011_GWA2_42_14]OGZ97528.1 MAG: arginine--tRNA ligase [Candidatus Sungbacteria bacterium RIFCSPHIGHO2_02_FULL_41_12b]OHA12913.1 MAG: arginine--tRNA ligase [Candidatus Sungbacteria bacterium RIFCSPLOWO2_12_FULL_41_11]
MIRTEIKKAVLKAVVEKFGNILMPEFLVEAPENPAHGDYSANIALLLSKILNKNPLEIAGILKENVGGGMWEAETAPPGFINFRLSEETLESEFQEILKKKNIYGKPQTTIHKLQSINIEFISANPTGPITMGNARGAFLGDVLANVLEFFGAKVCREYYINDAKSSTQIKELGKTALGRGMSYLSPYVKEKFQSPEFRKIISEIKSKNPRNMEGEVGFALTQKIQKENQVNIENIFKIKFNKFFSEESLYKSGLVKKIQAELKKKNLVYEKDGALWLKAKEYGDTEDRVLVRQTGEPTYALPDLSYHWNKFKVRKFDKVIDIWGADHHGYAPRLVAALKALGIGQDKIKIIITQLVRLIEDGKEVKMSKRRGEFITLEELIKEVGPDAARFFFLMHSPDTHMDFDMKLAKERSMKNPVYYVQYAYVRCSSILGKSPPSLKLWRASKIQIIKLLNTDEERMLIKKLMQFPEVVEDTAGDFQVIRLTRYALELSKIFHNFYEKQHVLSENLELQNARLVLVSSTQIVLHNILGLLGISKPEKM